VGRNGMSRRKHSFLSIPLKPQIFISPGIGRKEGNEILLKLSKYPYIFNILF